MPNTKTISKRDIQISLRNTTIAGAFGIFFFMIVQNGPIPLMLEKLGANGVTIGLTASLIQLGMLVQIPAAFFTERLTRRKLFWAITTITSRAALALPGIYLLAHPDQQSSIVWLTLIAIGFFSFLSQTSAPAWFSWMADLVPETIRAAFWSKRQGVVMTASVISVAFTGWFLDLFPESTMAGFGWLLIFAAVMGVLDGIVHWHVAEPAPTPPNRTHSVAKRIFQPLKNRDFLYFTLAMCVWFFAAGIFIPFLNVYLKATFGVTYTHLSAIQLAGMLSGVVSSFFGGRLIERMGLRTYGLAMLISAPVLSVAWFFLNGHTTGQLPVLGSVPQPVMILFLITLIAGGIWAGVGMMQLNLLSALAPPEGRTMAMAVHWTLVGLLSAAGPVIGGWIKDYICAHPIHLQLYAETEFSYFHILIILHALLIWFVMLPLLSRIHKKDGEWPLEQAVLEIFILTPLRFVRSAYNFNLALSSAAINTVIETTKKLKKDDEDRYDH